MDRKVLVIITAAFVISGSAFGDVHILTATEMSKVFGGETVYDAQCVSGCQPDSSCTNSPPTYGGCTPTKNGEPCPESPTYNQQTYETHQCITGGTIPCCNNHEMWCGNKNRCTCQYVLLANNYQCLATATYVEQYKGKQGDKCDSPKAL